MAKGSVDYHKRVDFRALDVFVDSIDAATKPEIQAAIKTAKQFSDDMIISPNERRIWKNLATLLRKELKEFSYSGKRMLRSRNPTSKNREAIRRTFARLKKNPVKAERDWHNPNHEWYVEKMVKAQKQRDWKLLDSLRYDLTRMNKKQGDAIKKDFRERYKHYYGKNPVKARKKNPEHEVRELILYAENTYELHNQYESIIKNLKRKAKRGIYDPVLAAKLWKYWIDEAVKRYNKEILGGTYSLRQNVFTVADRKQAAKEMEAQEREDILAQTNPKRRKKVARKKRRSAAQIAATKKMRAGLRRWKAGKKKKRKTSVHKKRRNPVRKKRTVTKRKKSARSGLSSLWLVFACKGKDVKFLKSPAESTHTSHWTRDRKRAQLFRNKSFAQKSARRYGHKAWQIGAATHDTTIAQIRAACSKA